ncbi:MAG: Rha family transcriptional regulator [Rhodoferax sp.]
MMPAVQTSRGSAMRVANKVLIEANSGHLYVHSNIIASLLDRPHKNVMRDIETLIENGTISRLSVEPRDYIDSRGKTQPAYRLTERDALVLMPFIGGKKRLKAKPGWWTSFCVCVQSCTALPARMPTQRVRLQ